MPVALAGFFTAILVVFTGTTAHADRPIVPERVDQCSEIRGVQDSSNRGYTWRWAVKTPESGDCRRLNLLSTS